MQTLHSFHEKKEMGVHQTEKRKLYFRKKNPQTSRMEMFIYEGSIKIERGMQPKHCSAYL